MGGKIRRFVWFLLFVVSSSLFAQALIDSKVVDLTSSLSKKAIQPGDSVRLTLRVNIKPDWHINAHKPLEAFLIPTVLKLEALPAITWRESKYPEPKAVKFEFSDSPLLLYEKSVDITTQLAVSTDIKPGDYVLRGELSYQGCNDETCLPPTSEKFEITLKVIEKSEPAFEKADALIHPLSADSAGTKAATPELTASEARARDILEKGLFSAVFFFFVAGLALNLTPCVYPVIPITVSFFGSQAKVQKGLRYIIALFYVLGIALIFAVLGLISALAGKQWGFLFQNPWFVVIIALVLLAMAASMFGAFEIRIPSKLMTSLGQSRKGVLGSFIMGLTVGVVIAPCAAGLIIGLLGLVAKMGIVVKGTVLFFFMGLGLGLPYLFLATFSSFLSKMPKSGMWMVWVRKLFGILLIGVAFYFLIPQASRIPDQQSFYFGLISLFGGLFLGFLDQEPGYSRGFKLLRAIGGILFIVLGIFWMNQAIESLEAAPEKIVKTEPIAWVHFQNEKLDDFKANNKPIFIDFYADWCAPCKKMDRTTFVDSAVVELSKQFTMIKVDCTNPTADVTVLMKKFNVVGLPTLVFIDPSGEERQELRAVEYLGSEKFVARMNQILAQGNE